MEDFAIQPDEAVLYEGTVKCKTYQRNLYQGNLLVTLTSQKLIFEKEKGIFKKERELVDIIPLESVKVYNDAAQIKTKGFKIAIQTIQKNLEIEFPGPLEARKFSGLMINAVTGTTLAQRGSDLIKDAFTIVDDTLGLDTRETIKGVLENGIKGTIWNGIKKRK